MRKAKILVHDVEAATLTENNNQSYVLQYINDYIGEPVSLTLEVRNEPYQFEKFPAFLDGLLPEGVQLEALLRNYKIDAYDFFSQIVLTGKDLVGAVTVEECENNDK